jgi:hypothetical protein
MNRDGQLFLELTSTGILHLRSEVAMLHQEAGKNYEEHCADDDSCELCRGVTQIITRALNMDDESVWDSRTKEGGLLFVAAGFIDDFCSYSVLLIRRETETGLCYREGIIELQQREWKAAAPVRMDMRLA